MSSLVPNKFYVARVYRSSEEILGFMVVADNEETKKFKDSKEKADRWATPNRSYTNQKAMDAIYVDNTPRSGFRLVTNVSRYSTSNVVWRIMHPEGFEFEITSDNMCDLLETNTIIEGEFQDELFLTSNKKLVNEKTKLFADMIAKAEAKKEKEKNQQEVEIGDVICMKIKETYSDYTDREFLYCGRYHAIAPNKNEINRYNVAVNLDFASKSTLRFVIKDIADGRYYAVSKLAEFTIRRNVPIDRTTVISEMNEQLRNNHNYIGTDYYYENYIPYNINPLYINDKPYKYEDLRVEFISKRASEIESLSHNLMYRVGNQLIAHFRFEKTNSYSYHGSRTVYERSLKYDGNEYSGNQYNGSRGVLHSLSGFTIAGYTENGKPILASNGGLNVINLPQDIEVGYYTL